MEGPKPRARKARRLQQHVNETRHVTARTGRKSGTQLMKPSAATQLVRDGRTTRTKPTRIQTNKPVGSEVKQRSYRAAKQLQPGLPPKTHSHCSPHWYLTARPTARHGRARLRTFPAEHAPLNYYGRTRGSGRRIRPTTTPCARSTLEQPAGLALRALASTSGQPVRLRTRGNGRRIRPTTTSCAR